MDNGSGMNILERSLYDLVKRRPILKRVLVRLYQRLCSVVPIRIIDTQYHIQVREGYFFGFHDKCPWSPNNTMLLAHKFDIPNRMPRKGESVKIGYFTGDSMEEYHLIGETYAWNWQMGAMLQWVGATDHIICNDMDNSRLVARILDHKGNVLQVVSRPVAAIHPNGRKALGYSFARLKTVAPAYSYASGIDDDPDHPCPNRIGLYLVDLITGEVAPLFSISEIAKLEPESSMEDAYHYFTHCLFSPSGERFVFFHRWVGKHGRIWTRMISCDLNGGDKFIFRTNGMVSHIAWQDDQTILAYASVNDQRDHYLLFKDKSVEYTVIGKGFLSQDGHPQFSSDHTLILTDTYPDRFRRQSLLIYNLEEDRLITLAKLHSPFTFTTDVRCDLHPRWNRDSSWTCFDSAHTGSRSLCTIELT